MKYIMGLDLSLTSTGYAVLNGNGELVDNGLLQVKSKEVKRLQELSGLLDELLHRYCPDLVGIEGYAYGKHNRAHQIGEWGGIARLMLAGMKIPTIVMPPTSVKKFVTGKGNAPKDEMRLGVYKRWGMEFASNDEVDAYAVARMALACKQPHGLTKFQLEAIEGLEVA
jgi:crossover junction endodeoxyribonuclease RuvC